MNHIIGHNKTGYMWSYVCMNLWVILVVIHENIGYMTSHTMKIVHITTFPRLYTCQKLDENYITKNIT